MIPEFALGLLIGVIIGAIAGCILYYYIGTPKCNHNFEEVLNTISQGKSVVVHMCKKCGKRKITKV